MKRKLLLALLLSTSTMALPANAQSLEDQMVNQLRGLGYNSIEVSRTWLGRTRIEAEGTKIRREIIFNSRTGEILRDYSTNLKSGLSQPSLLGASAPIEDGDDGDDGDEGSASDTGSGGGEPGGGTGGGGTGGGSSGGGSGGGGSAGASAGGSSGGGEQAQLDLGEFDYLNGGQSADISFA